MVDEMKIVKSNECLLWIFLLFMNQVANRHTES